MNSLIVYSLQKATSSLRLQLPSSKSLANRALILSALSKGNFHLKGDFRAVDIQLMIDALRSIGISLREETDGLLISNDLSWMLNELPLELDLGNSGTSIRFLSSLLCLRRGQTTLTGSDRMKERPIGDLCEALEALGVGIRFLEREGYPPLLITPPRHLSSETRIRGNVSSQFLSSLLLSASSFPEGMRIQIEGDLVSGSYVDLTLQLLKEWGIEVERGDDAFFIRSQVLSGVDFQVEGDASAAVYWWAFAYLHDCSVTFSNLSSHSVQGDCRFESLLKHLRKGMACTDEGFDLDMNDMPDASLMLMALASTLDKPVRISGIGSLRVKETDRISAMATELRKLGVSLTVGEDWMKVSPGFVNNVQNDQIVQIDTYDDHRIAMSFAILSTLIGPLEIMDPNCVRKSYPSFWRDLETVVALQMLEN